jgi:hypothetical protein
LVYLARLVAYLGCEESDFSGASTMDNNLGSVGSADGCHRVQMRQPMKVGWDAYYVPHWKNGKLDYFVFVSHDSFIGIYIRTQTMHEKALNILKGIPRKKGLLKADS